MDFVWVEGWHESGCLLATFQRRGEKSLTQASELSSILSPSPVSRKRWVFFFF